MIAFNTLNAGRKQENNLSRHKVVYTKEFIETIVKEFNEGCSLGIKDNSRKRGQ